MTFDASSRPRQNAFSKPFDLDGLVASYPQIAERVSQAKAAAVAGDVVRRARTLSGLTQAELAARIGSTQAHVSELERGRGSNGPTVATLDKIMIELGDHLVLTTRGEEDALERERSAETAAWLGETAAEAARTAGSSGLAPAVAALAGRRSDADPARTMMLDGFLAGAYFAFGVAPGQSAEALRGVRDAIRRLLGDTAEPERAIARPVPVARPVEQAAAARARLAEERRASAARSAPIGRGAGEA